MTQSISNCQTGDTILVIFAGDQADSPVKAVNLTGVRPYAGAHQKSVFQALDATDPRYAPAVAEARRRASNQIRFAALLKPSK